MLSINDSFIGYCESERNVDFSGSDQLLNFQNQLKKQPQDWYYRHNSISYVRNKLGHRCKDLDDLNQDNYILFTGCSHTEGIGVELEKTYPYLIAKSLGCDYYNLALGGTGIDVLMYNLTIFNLTVTKKPKYLIVQYPDVTRYSSMDMDNSIASHGAWEKNPDHQTFVILHQQLGLARFKLHLAKEIINLLGSPSLSTLFLGDPKIKEYEVPIDYILNSIDLGRDMHPGIESHKKNANCIIDKLKEKFNN